MSMQDEDHMKTHFKSIYYTNHHGHNHMKSTFERYHVRLIITTTINKNLSTTP